MKLKKDSKKHSVNEQRNEESKKETAEDINWSNFLSCSLKIFSTQSKTSLQKRMSVPRPKWLN